METKTCPHCTSVADRDVLRDTTGDDDWDLYAWECTECLEIFWTETLSLEGE